MNEPVVSLIVAMDASGAIGVGGRLPWRIPEDLRRFRRLTMGGTLIMGRKTYQSLKTPLEGRRTVVLTRDPGFRAVGEVQVCHSVADALGCASPTAEGLRREVFVVGGAEVYAAFLGRADRLYLTAVEGTFEGDTFFPPVDWSEWRLLEARRGDDPEGPPREYRVYERRGVP